MALKAGAIATLAAALAALAVGQGRAAETGPGDIPLQELPPQKLQSGQCALALWTRTTPARRVFMAFSQPGHARVQASGRTVELSRTAWTGEPAYGHYETETFSGGGLELKTVIELDRTNSLVGGAVVSSGTLEYRDAKGWSMVLPVAGLVACQD